MMVRCLRLCKKQSRQVYTACKNLVKSLLPYKLLQRNEMRLRKVAALAYNGNKFQCNICYKRLSRFATINNDLLCPACGSLSRTRQLWDFLNQQQLLKGKLLHFSPPSILNQVLSTHKALKYTSTDYKNEFAAQHHYDITNLDLASNSFDLIICYHVLEHILQDAKAMEELYRVLTPGGTLLLQTPFKEGDIYEDDTIVTDEQRLEAFGQRDHVRIYSKEGLSKRFEQINPTAGVKTIRLPAHEYHGIVENHLILVKKRDL